MAGISRHEDIDIAVVGAGVSGLCMAIDLLRKDKNRTFVVLEKASDLGGTWYRNRYPGSCADAESPLYCYSFAPNLACKTLYPSRDEIFAYLVRTVRNWNVYEHIRFNSLVHSAVWDSAANQWQLTVQRMSRDQAAKGEDYTIFSNYLVSAVVQLNAPLIPDIPGSDQFKGKTWHSFDWDRSESLKGKRIAVVGTGASGVQLIPEVVAQAEHVTVFQRSPNWIVPRGNRLVSALRRILYRIFPHVWKNDRVQFLMVGEERHSAVKDPASGKIGAKFATKHMYNQIPSRPDLRAQMTPDYPFGCKRVLLSNNFFPAMDRPNVTLEIRPIERLGQRRVVVAGGAEHVIDNIIFATGFRSQNFASHISIAGLHGRTLQDIWRDHPRAYYGVAVEALPNFSMLYGPNSNLSHVSILLMIEAQVRYVGAMIEAVCEARMAGVHIAIRPQPQKVDKYNQDLQNTLRKTVFAVQSCTSWYKALDGTVVNNWPGTALEYQRLLSSIDWGDYDIDSSQPESKTIKRKTKQSLGSLKKFPLLGLLLIQRLLLVVSCSASL